MKSDGGAKNKRGGCPRWKGAYCCSILVNTISNIPMYLSNMVKVCKQGSWIIYHIYYQIQYPWKQGWGAGAGAGRSRVFLAPWSGSRLKKKRKQTLKQKVHMLYLEHPDDFWLITDNNFAFVFTSSCTHVMKPGHRLIITREEPFLTIHLRWRNRHGLENSIFTFHDS